MFTHDSRTRRRLRLTRLVSVLTIGIAVPLAGGSLSPARADTPAGWESTPPVSWLEVLLVLVLIPLAVIAVVSFLAFVPALVSQSGYQPGQSWRGESEWFGGPTKGVEAADHVTPEQLEAGSAGTGGTSGRW